MRILNITPGIFNSSNFPNILDEIRRKSIEKLIFGPGVYKRNYPSYSLFHLHDINNLILEGSGSVILDGGGSTQHVVIIGDNSDRITFKNLTIIRGNTALFLRPDKIPQVNNQRFNSIFTYIDGAGILILGKSENIRITNCTISQNSSFMCGGGISIQQKNTRSPVRINNSRIYLNNSGHTGSGIDVLTPGSKVNLTNCRIYHNRSNTLFGLNGPHGQISVFPRTFARLANCMFKTSGKFSSSIDYYRAHSHYLFNVRHNIGYYELLKQSLNPGSALYQIIRTIPAYIHYCDMCYPWMEK